MALIFTAFRLLAEGCVSAIPLIVTTAPRYAIVYTNVNLPNSPQCIIGGAARGAALEKAVCEIFLLSLHALSFRK